MKHLQVSQLKELAPTLRAGDEVALSGVVYTARDAAHKRFFQLLDEGKALPFDIHGAVLYFAGPTPGKEGAVCGSFGPTTSSRMDPYSPRLLELGLAAMVGKGERNQAVCDALCQYGGVYFAALGGEGALAARHIKSLQVVAFEDLGCESVKRLEFDEFPLIVAVDCQGGDIYKQARKDYAL